MSTAPLAATISNATPLQNSAFIGGTLLNILYGIDLVLFFETIQVLLSKSRRAYRSANIFYGVFSTIMLFAISVWLITTAIFCQKMWLVYSSYPGGADVWFAENISVWYMDFGTTAVILLQLMTDALMIHRCRVIWSSYRVVIIPIFLWVSTLVLGIFVDWTSSAPGGNFFAGVAAQLGLAYYSVSVFLNVLLTCLICYRVIQHGRRIRQHLGPDHATFYFSIVTLVVESMLPYTLSGVAFLVSLGTGSATSGALLPVYIFLMCISPQMLILRVLSGRAWDSNTSRPAISTIKFSPRSVGVEQSGMEAHVETSKVYMQDTPPDSSFNDKIGLSRV